MEYFAVDGLGFLELDDVGSHDLAGHDMVGEDRGQLSLVFRLQQVLNRSRREFGESGVGRGEDREWSSSLHRIDQACGTESGRQRLELTSRNRGVDDVLRIRSHIISPSANFERVMAIDPVVVLLLDRLGSCGLSAWLTTPS